MRKAMVENPDITFIRGGHGLTGVKNTYGEYWCAINKKSNENKLYLPVDGRGELFLNGVHYAMEKYKWFLIGAEDVRSYYTTDDNYFEHYTLHFYGEISGEYIKKKLNLPDFIPLEPDEYKKAVSLMSRFSMYDVSATADLYRLFLNKGKVYNALAYYIELAEKKKLVSKNVIDKNAQKRIMLLQSVESALKNQTSTSRIAKDIGMNEKYFQRYFKKLLHISFYNLTQKTKIHKIKSLLTDSHYNINEIARISGFENSKYFYEYFKKHIGMTPLQFRRCGGGCGLHDSTESHKTNKNRKTSK